MSAHRDGRLRIVAYRTLGPTFLDASWDGERGVLYTPTYAGRAGEARISDAPPEGWPGIVPSLLWRRAVEARPGEAAPGTLDLLREEGTLLWTTTYDRARFVPIADRAARLTDGESVYRIAYGEAYRHDPRSGFAWPERLALEDPARGETVTLSVRAVRIDPRVPLDRYRTRIPPGVPVSGP